MTEPTDKELLELLGVKVEKKKISQLSPFEERLIVGFEEIQRFYEKFNRLPSNLENADLFERRYAIRLQRLQESDDYMTLLEPIDHHGLLSRSDSDKQFEKKEKLDDAELLAALGVENENESITNLRHVRSNKDRRVAEEIANREICEDFSKFKPLFQQIQSDLNQGIRKTISYEGRPEINIGNFFIIGGQKAFIFDIGKFFMQPYGISDARLRIIFDNGTESGMLLRSFQRALVNDETARKISEPNLGPLFQTNIQKGDKESGTIYVLRSKSNLPYISDNRNLIHKIGVTTSTIEKRIANAKNNPTFLMADVKIIASYKLFNINPLKLENLIQKVFRSVRLDIKIPDRFGKFYSPKEWYFVPLHAIEDAVERIKDGTITRYQYDLETAKLIQSD